MAVFITASGLYSSDEIERHGLPERNNEFVAGVIPFGVEQFVLYLRFSGNPGSYILSSDVKAYTEQPEQRVSGSGDLRFDIKVDGSANFRTLVNLHGWAMGMYTITLTVNGDFAAAFNFSIGH